MNNETVEKEKNTAQGGGGDEAVGEAMTEGMRRTSAVEAEGKKEEGMTDNNTYNLIEQLAVENKSLWRIKNNYKADAKSSNCQDCINVWNEIEKDKEKHVKQLKQILKTRI